MVMIFIHSYQENNNFRLFSIGVFNSYGIGIERDLVKF